MYKPANSSLTLLLLLVSLSLWAQEADERVLFVNVHVFDGVSENRIENASVLVEGNLIRAVSTEVIDAPGATVIDRVRL